LSPNGRFSEFEKLDKIFFQILNFLDARVWIAADLRVTIPKVLLTKPVVWIGSSRSY